MVSSGRPSGKSTLARMWAEAMLQEGKRVMFASLEKVEIRKRHKHLTSITTVRPTHPQEGDGDGK